MESKPKVTRLFDSRKVTSYWHDQKPPKSGELFIDPLFPPDDHTLLGQDKNGNWIDPVDGPKKSADIDVSQIEWKRPSEIFQKFLLFEESIDCNDIKQGSIGNCYFLSALASLSEFPFLIYQIFRTKEPVSEGYYEVIFYLNGELKIVVVDDYFPVEKGTNKLRFARPLDNELWVIVLEKAWAKVNGGYANIISGWPSDPLGAFTGFATEKIGHDDLTITELWNVISASDKSDSILCTSTRPNENISEMGLVKGHAYTLIGARIVKSKGKEVRLVRVRNPWGYKEWNGDWSDSSPLWTAESKADFPVINVDDGAFWMSIEDLQKYFMRTDICHILYDANMKHFPIKGEAIKIPHVFNIYIQEQEKVSLSITRKFWRYNREIRDISHPATLIVGKYYPNTKTITSIEGAFECYDDCEMSRVFEPGFYVACTYVAYSISQSPKPTDYFFKIASRTPFFAKHENTDENFDFIRELMKFAIKDAHPEILQKTNEVSYFIENNFRRTGLGLRYVYNPIETSYQKWTNNAAEIVNMAMLPPFEKSPEFDFMVPPKGDAICLGMKTDSFGSYWFNLKSSFKTYSCKAGEDPTKTKKIHFEDYCSKNVISEHVDENYYDYISTSLEEAHEKLEFEKLDVVQIMIEHLEKQHPQIIKLLKELPPLDDIDEKNLRWTQLNQDNGYYVGQVNENNAKHGRGAYCWKKEGDIWVGYWLNNIKHHYGKLMDSSFKVTFEGEYQKGQKNGIGTLHFANGDFYKGSFLNDKRTGQGDFHWSDGSRWVGNFTNGQMNGKGMYYDVDGSYWEVEYRNGNLVE